MPTLKFYTDTHVDKQVSYQLQRRDIDTIRCQDIGLADADDEQHLTWATENKRVLITFDKGFRGRAFNWLAAGKSHGGVFICKHDLQSEAGIGKIVKTCQFYYDAVEEGAASLDDFRNRVFDIE